MKTLNGTTKNDSGLIVNMAKFCNAKWDEANGLASDAWECYMELGRELRVWRDGKMKGRFTEWCNENLQFSYDWANILIKAYNRYELSEFTDPPQINIQSYAEPLKLLESTPNDPPQTEQNSMKSKKTKTNLALTPIESFCKEENFDDLQTEIVKVWYTLTKKLVKKYGIQAVGEAQEIILKDYPNLYKNHESQEHQMIFF